MADLYDLVTLDGIFRNFKNPTPPFWLNFFNRQINFDTPKIQWDVVQGDDRGLAPFVVPTSQGRPQKLDPYDTRAFAPAYVKINDVVNPAMHVARVPGEGLGGTLSLGQRRRIVIAELMRRARIKFDNRYEWLAARAIIDGQVTISGEDYPSTLVDFRRNANLTETLTGAAQWDETTANPLADLRNMRIEANGISGVRISKVIMGQNAYNSFAARVDLRDMMDKRYGGQQVAMTLITDGYEGQEYIGRIAGASGQGALDIWVDSSKYIDPEDGQEKFYLDQNTVVGVNEAVQGIRCFGAIMDTEADYRPLTYFFKNYRTPNPSLEYLLSQSAPLMVPKNPDATFKIVVQ